jgi:hypothetical protein
MKNISVSSFLKSGIMISVLLFIGLIANGQDSLKVVSVNSDSVNVIINASCTPCHTNEGGLMAKSKLNFSLWSSYPPEKQKERAAKMYSQLENEKMPPKTSREKHPELIPTPEQIAVIKRWSESFPPDNK